MKVSFPEYNKDWGKDNSKNDVQYHRYYPIHYKYFYNILIKGGVDVDLIPVNKFDRKSQTDFEIIIDNHLCLVDFSDFQGLKCKEIEKYKAIFKFHYHPKNHGHIKNVYPFSPVNFHNWDLYKEIIKNNQYTATGKVCNQQSPAGAALDRRNKVRSLLIKEYADNLIWQPTSKQRFFENISDCLVSICVPGARNDMLDRGHGQYMFFGVCTISPKLVTYLSYGKQPEAGIHYVECQPDYSDLIEKIEWCRNNPEECIQIGKNAKKLMEETSLPEKQVEWIKKCIRDE